MCGVYNMCPYIPTLLDIGNIRKLARGIVTTNPLFQIIANRKKIAEDTANCFISFDMNNTVKDSLGHSTYQGKTTWKRLPTYSIVVSNDLNDKDKETVFIHETLHITEDSYEPRYLKSIMKQSKNYVARHSITDEVKQQITDMHHSLANVIEDIRIESRGGVHKLGISQRFKGLRKELGTNISIPLTPVTKLLAVRMFRPDILEDDEMTYYINKHQLAEYQSHKGATKIYNQICKEKLHPYLDSILPAMKKQQEQQDEQDDLRQCARKRISDLNDESMEKQNALDDEAKKCLEALDYDAYSEKKSEKQQVKSKFNRKMGAQKSKITKSLSITKEIDTKSGNTNESINQPMPYEGRLGNIDLTDAVRNNELINEKCNEASTYGEYDEDEIDQLDLNEEQQQQIEEIRLANSLIDVTKPSIISEVNYNELDKTNTEYILNTMLVSEIRRSIDAVTTLKDKNYYSGNTLNLTEVINSRHTKDTKIFNRKSGKIKLSVLFSVDCSGSMSGEPIDGCRRIVYNTMKAIERNPHVEFECVGWSGDSVGNVYYRHITKASDVLTKLQTGGGHSSTPTMNALIHAEQILKNMKGQKKVLILLTDGTPSDHAFNGVVLSKEDLLNECNKKIQHIKSKAKIVPIILGSNRNFAQMFRTGYIEIGEPKDLPKILMRQFRKVLVSELR